MRKAARVDHNYLFMDGSVNPYYGVTWGDSRFGFDPGGYSSHFIPDE